MAELTATGRLKLIGPTTTAGSGFEKRPFAIETEEQYPQTVEFELHQGKVDEVLKFKEGDLITVSFNLRGRVWVNPQGETKIFNTLQAWQIRQLTTGNQNPPQQSPVREPVVTYYHTATDAPYDAYIKAGWNQDQLVAAGKGYYK